MSHHTSPKLTILNSNVKSNTHSHSQSTPEDEKSRVVPTAIDFLKNNTEVIDSEPAQVQDQGPGDGDCVIMDTGDLQQITSEMRIDMINMKNTEKKSDKNHRSEDGDGESQHIQVDH